MRNFFIGILSTLVGVFIALLLLFFLMIGFASSLASEEKVVVNDNSVLHLNLTKPITEREVEDPLANLFGAFAGDAGTNGLIEIKSAIRKAKSDDKIKGIYLEPGLAMGGFASLREIRDALVDFKSSGKFIVTYAEYYTEAAYYLASVADEIHLNPLGVIEFNGLSSEVVFLKGMFEKLEIEPQIFRVGEFKSAVEPFFRKDMSAENREQVSSFLNSLYDTYLEDVAISLGKEVSELRAISNEMQVRTAAQALKMGLATSISYEDQAKDAIREKLGIEKDKKIASLGYSKYRKSYTESNLKAKGRVAVIMANGQIMGGEGSETMIGSATLAEEIKKARLDKKVSAVVLRINSPGGSLVASDVIWREVMLCRKVKPVIASMSDVAASGGYYIAMAADTIVAQPNTITGSIGIFGVLLNVKGFINNKLGITTESVSTGKWSDMMTISRPLTDAEKAVIQAEVESGYETFTSKAAEGRSMTIDNLKSIASGRVWSGIEAKERGLVDVLGGLEDAIAIAATKAGIADDYSVRYLPTPKTFLEQLSKSMGQEARIRMVKWELGEYYPIYEETQRLKNLHGIQALMPYDFNIK